MDVSKLNEDKQYYRLERSETGRDIYNYYYTNHRRYKKRLFWTWENKEDAMAEISDIKGQIQKQVF